MSISTNFQEVLEDGDIFFPLSKWPPIAKENMLKKHKGNNERYYLMRFLCYNGLKPEIASNWILREGQYDSNALKDQQLMTKKAREQDFYARGKIFNMRYGRTDSLYDKPPVESQWETQPPEQPAPNPMIGPELIPEKTYNYDDLVARYPPPERDPYGSAEDHQFNLALWKAETRKFFAAMNKAGYRYVP